MATKITPSFDSGRRQVFVVGNEAADADSLVSAYATAALLNNSEVQGIPLAQIPREEFHLRGDALSLFRRAGIEVLADGSPKHLFFWDEVDWDVLDKLTNRSLVLTDHNQMTPQTAKHFEGKVEWVLDHHAPSSAYPDIRKDVVNGLGSACTLVTEQWLANGKDALPQELAVLLAGVILLDTRNFDPEEKKGT